MSSNVVPLIFTIVAWFLWAIASSYVVVTLKKAEPDIYNRVGAPKLGRDIWSNRLFGSAFDAATMLFRFRHLAIRRGVLFQLTVVALLRWATLISFLVLAVGTISRIAAKSVP